MASLNRSERLRVLLANGYFPAELPPPFVTDQFAKFRKSIFSEWSGLGKPNSSTPQKYSISRIGYKRRQLSIVNPISQFYLSKKIADNWVSIWKFLEQSEASLDKPQLVGGLERAIPKPDFSRIALKNLETSAEYDHILYTDISRFYGTIYTHSIPWALHGKGYSKSNLHNSHFKKSLGNQLDVLVRKGQSNQTVGIPIGPDTSRIIAEIISVAVEKDYSKLSGNDLSGAFRYVDDWFIGHNLSDESEAAISHLAQVYGEYELELNIEKTKITDVRSSSIAHWPEELTSLTVRSKNTSTQAKEISRFFSAALELAEKFRGENVLDYALKISRSFQILGANYVLFESFVLRIARADRITLPTVTQILVNYHGQGASLNLPRCRKLILDTIKCAFPLGHSAEVAWSLFLARELKLKIPAIELEGIAASSNAVVALLCLDLEQRSLIDGHLDKSHWRSLATSQSLWDSTWLLAYEADLKGWLGGYMLPGHVEADPWFRALKSRRICFYDPNKTVSSFRHSSKIQRLRWNRLSNFEKLLFGSGQIAYRSE